MNRPTSRPPNKILLVEGSNDKHVVRHIRQRSQSISDLHFDIEDKGGLDALNQSIGAEIDVPGRQVVGILIDANNNVQARWASITRRLSDEAINAPVKPSPDGTVIDTKGKPRVGIWLMPDNESPGELEDFVAQMLPDDDSVWPLSQRYINDIPEAQRKFPEGKTLRAQLHAWLAAREDPRQMGLAIKARDLEIDGALCQKFIAWLEELFG